MYIKETKKRTVIKAFSWRVVATLNSWMVLCVVVSGNNLTKAVIMNITGFIIFYVFERIWSKIKYGRFIIKNENDTIKE